jgi:hypothetical protein
MLKKGWQFAYYKAEPASHPPAASSFTKEQTVWKDTTGRDRDDAILNADAAACQAPLRRRRAAAPRARIPVLHARAGLGVLSTQAAPPIGKIRATTA